MSDEKRNAKKGKKGKKSVIIIVVVVIALIAGVFGGGYALFSHYYGLIDNDLDTENVQPGDEDYLDEDDNGNFDEIYGIDEELKQNLLKMSENSDLYSTNAFNIMLLGVDSRGQNFSGRSDSMILFSINKETKKVTMCSFLRDIYASIPGHGNTKLCHAYAYGGAELLKETMKANFGITIDKFVVVNFRIVADVVDAVGGVDLDLSASEIKVMNSYINHQNRLWGNPAGTDIISESEAGTVHCNGNRALAYSRVRYVGTDFARTGRQRTVINKCIEKGRNMKFSEILDLTERFLPQVKTDLSQGDCASLLLLVPDAANYSVESMAVPVDGTWKYDQVRGMSVISVNFEKNSQAWHDAVEGTSQNG